jgi:hypothetical protein
MIRIETDPARNMFEPFFRFRINPGHVGDETFVGFQVYPVAHTLFRTVVQPRGNCKDGAVDNFGVQVKITFQAYYLFVLFCPNDDRAILFSYYTNSHNSVPATNREFYLVLGNISKVGMNPIPAGD